METASAYDVGEAIIYLLKEAADSVYVLKGELRFSDSGYLYLKVPNDLVNGAFNALHEPGIELPPNKSGNLNAHISVMSPDEVKTIGPDNINERGKTFSYTVTDIKTAVPNDWEQMSRVWFLEVKSPELQKLRRTYGLSPIPEHPFHITIAVRRKHVLYENDVSKAAATAYGEGESGTPGGVQTPNTTIQQPAYIDPLAVYDRDPDWNTFSQEAIEKMLNPAG